MGHTSSPIQQIEDPLFSKREVEVFIKRDDLLHPFVMGNKWRKLKHNLMYVKQQSLKGILTLGGAFSNHIAATAAACHENSIPAVGIIRGDELSPDSNATLRFAASQGMSLHFVNRSRYKTLRNDPQLLATEFSDYFILPEGGTNERAIKGCQELIVELPGTYDYLVVPVGTGGTLSGLLKGMEGKGTLIGIASLKGSFIKEELSRLLTKHHINYTNYQIISDYHFGGYGRVTDELVAFINRTKTETGILFDPIYTGKMYFGVKQLVEKCFFPEGSQILIIHTGGLQGISGYNEFNEKKILI